MFQKIAATLLFCALSLAAADNRVYELRTYYTLEGRLDALLARFREHTTKLFEKHGIQNIGYWVPKDKPNTLVYIVVHKDMESAKTNWDAFRKDPDWVKVRTRFRGQRGDRGTRRVRLHVSDGLLEAEMDSYRLSSPSTSQPVPRAAPVQFKSKGFF